MNTNASGNTKVVESFANAFPLTWLGSTWGTALLAIIWTISNPFEGSPLND